MNKQRLVIVTPRYWPQVGEAEVLAADFADEFAALGARPLVLTGKWSAGWPDAIRVREIDVIRVPHAPKGGWGTLRYMIDISRWLRQQRASLGAAYVFGLRYEAYATLGALRGSQIPVVLRCDESGPHGDCRWQAQTRFGERMRLRCRGADGIVAANASVEEELLRSGYDRQRIRLIPSGVPVGAVRSADKRHRARTVLAESNHDLGVAEYAPVMVFAGRLADLNSLTLLLQAWRDIGRRWPSARFWLIGEGPARDGLYERIIAWELRYQVFMPGTFEDLTDVWHAADVFVLPAHHSSPHMTLAAMAAGLPVIAPDSATNREMIEHDLNGLLVPPADQPAWTAAMSYFCDNPSAAVTMGNAAQRIVEQRYSRKHMAEQHLAWWKELRAES